MSNKVDWSNTSGPACLSGDALVAYLYDECAADERQRIEQHLASCAACATEIDALGGTRVQLASWAPPDAALGFRISSAAAVDNVVPFTPSPAALAPAVRLPWWRQPLPAWGQAVAATLIFGLGLAAGSRQVTVAPTATAGAAVSPSQLANLESRLRREMAAMRTAPATTKVAAPVATAARLDDGGREAVLRQVRQLLRESEDRQEQVFTLRAAQVARDAEIQRRVDVATLRQSLEQMQGSTSEVRREQERLYRILESNVSQRR